MSTIEDLLDVRLQRGSKVNEILNKYEIDVRLISEVNKQFPDATLIREYGGLFSFSAKSVNKNYNKIEFSTYNGLWAHPMNIINLMIDNQEHTILVRSKPQKILLLHHKYTHNGLKITFPLTKNNMKKYQFDYEKFFNGCKMEIFNHLKEHETEHVNYDLADQSIKNLLSLM